ncbi:hypothetical protein EI94DRAFT_1751656 [Lactarius quietus]|nr:hypothetical protein EI94DRAFT_1751656 [Lactarius quietus]
MDPPNAFPYTDEELDAAGLTGEGVSESIVKAIQTMREHPDLLNLSLFALQCMNLGPTQFPFPNRIANLSQSEITHGRQRSLPLGSPRKSFPIPDGEHPHLPTKTAHGVFNTPLNAVWGTVGPQIRELLKAQKIRYSAISTARFVTHGEDGKNTRGPIVIWITTHPGSATAENAHDASQDILALLKANGVEGAVVEWIEGVVERLFLRIADDTNPTHYVPRFPTASPGMPIANAEREAQGTVTLFFHENKDKRGAPSAKVFGVSNCHVLREDTTVGYAGAPPQHVRLAGFRSGYGTDPDLLAREIVELEAKPKSEDLEEAAKREKLAKVKKDIGALEAFYEDTNSQQGDIARQNIGRVDWAPEISVDVQGRKYTKDIGTFEVDAARIKTHFKGNVVDLGSKFTPQQLTDMFYPQSGGRTAFKFSANRQLRINGCVTRELLAVPDCFDSSGEPCLIVMKDGSTTDLTVGRYAGLEAYLCDDLGVESTELAIYNFDKQSGPFSAKGDSGSLIFDGEGRMVGILHSRMPKGGENHVTYATPAWWAIATQTQVSARRLQPHRLLNANIIVGARLSIGIFMLPLEFTLHLTVSF